jgi:hypothetical protein
MRLLETNVDDMSAELLAFAMERLFAAGARDAWFTPIQMKKGRPATMLSAIADAANEAAVAEAMLRETSTLGVRVHPIARREAERRVVEVATPLGPARVKVKRLAGRDVAASPEYDDCRAIALDRGLPLAEVYRVVESAARAALGDLAP